MLVHWPDARRPLQSMTIDAQPAPAATFVRSLQSVRGLAALTVCLFHAADLTTPDGTLFLAKTSWVRVLLDGHGAVLLFFVLSGYVLRLSLEDRAASGATMLQFLGARLFRLYPVVVAAVLLLTPLAWLLLHVAYAPLAILRNALLLDTSIDGALWSLQVEAFGSLGVILAFLAERRFGRWTAWAITLALVAWSFTAPALNGPPQNAMGYSFGFGYLLAITPAATRWPRAWALALLAGALAVFYGAHAAGSVLKQILMLIEIGAATAIVAAFASPALRGALQWPPIAGLGAISYSFYALHAAGSWIAINAVALLWRHGLQGPGAVATGFVIAVVATLPIALATYLAVERPGVVLGRRILRGRRPPAPIAVEARA
jgi:peptidoglycan/LPS O-acetylase OafA/YrhL